jgi:hypothetical protein
MTGAVTVGNSTVNSVVSNTGGLTVSSTTANTIVNTDYVKLSSNSTANATINSSSLSLSDLAIVNTTVVFIGNSTVNTSHSVATLQLANSTTNTTITPSSVFVGTFANSSYIKVDSANVTSNTLTLGTSEAAANGYTYLPNGFKLVWGTVSANSSDGQAVFSNAFSTAVYNISATSNATGTYAAAVISQNTIAAEIRTANDASTDVFFSAIGK